MQPVRRFLIILACLAPHGADAQTIPVHLRDCALFMKEAIVKLDEETREKFWRLQASMSADDFEECQVLSRIGFAHGFVPATYLLEPGRWIEVSLGGANIVEQGKSTRIRWGFVQPGIQFLPLRHSEVATGRPETGRHFLEFFAWTPDGPRRNAWTLMWHAFEVVRNDVIRVAGEPLIKVTAPEPPNAAATDVHQMASVRINDAGLVEWRVREGADERRGVIPSEADRQARAEQTRRREAASARVDWNRVGDVRRAPLLTYGDSDGCGNVALYGWSDDVMEAISLRADAELLKLSKHPQTFDLAAQPTALALIVHVYALPVRSWPFCSDFVQPTGPHEEWRARAGQITIELAPAIDASGEPRQRATIRVSGAVFINAQGVRVTQTQAITLTAIVGWFAG